MPSGGARARSGPAPDPHALRRDKDGREWTHLPAAGREGVAPTWPLGAKVTKRERELWEAEWRRPQALMWEAAGQELLVALYVSAVIASRDAWAKAADRAVVLRYMDDLGLTQGGLAKNRWVIDDVADEPTAPVRTDDDRSSAKARLRAISGGVAS